MAANSAATKVVVGNGIIVKPSAYKSNDIYILVMAKGAFTCTSLQDISLKIDVEQA
jgi:hypothetical protein